MANTEAKVTPPLSFTRSSGLSSSEAGSLAYQPRSPSSNSAGELGLDRRAQTDSPLLLFLLC